MLCRQLIQPRKRHYVSSSMAFLRPVLLLFLLLLLPSSMIQEVQEISPSNTVAQCSNEKITSFISLWSTLTFCRFRPKKNTGEGVLFVIFAEATVIYYHNKRLELFIATKSWSDAQAYCAARTSWNGKTGTLWSSGSSLEISYALANFPSSAWPVWTGGNRIADNTKFVWDGSNREYAANTGGSLLGSWVSWDIGEPNLSGECMDLRSSGKWDDVTCSTTLNFVCQFALDYVDLPGRRVRFYATTVTWATAQTNCNGITELGVSGRLATFFTEWEMDALHQLMITKSSENYAWVGASDATTEGTWSWVGIPGGDISFYSASACHVNHYCNWAPGEPNDSGGNEDCGALYTFSMNDLPCTESKPYFCEFPHTDEHAIGNKVFKYYSALTSWTVSKSNCEAATHSGVNGQLATLADSDEFHVVSSLYASNVNANAQVRVWLGYDAPGLGHKVGVHGIRQYDGTLGACDPTWPYFYCDYQAGEPNCPTCPSSIYLSGKFDDAPAGNTAPYICQFLVQNWVEAGGKRFAFRNNPKAWADNECGQEYYDGRFGQLASPGTPEEMNAIARLSYSYGQTGVWLGASKVSGTWRWVTGVELCSSSAAWCPTWATLEPSGDGDCVLLWPGRWAMNDMSCAVTYPHVCEFPASQNVSYKRILLQTTQTSRDECKTVCEAMTSDHRPGRQLAIGNSVEQALLTEMLLDTYAVYGWTGGERSGTDIKWPNGVIFYNSGGCQSYCNWATSDPGTTELYVETYMTGEWNDVTTRTGGMCLCELPVIGRTGYKEYEVISTPATYANAKLMCETQGAIRGSHAQLAIIESAEENAVVAELVGTLTVFLGGTDVATEGTWLWERSYHFSTGSTCETDRYCNWGGGQPSAGVGENYLGMTNGNWDDMSDIARPFVCEYIFSPSPTFTLSKSFSVTTAPSVTFSIIKTSSSTTSRPLTTSPSLPSTASSSRVLTLSISKSLPKTATVSKPITASLSVPSSPSVTMSPSRTKSPPGTRTAAITPSASFVKTASISLSFSHTFSILPPPTRTTSPTGSKTRSVTRIPTGTRSTSITTSKTASPTKAATATRSTPLTLSITRSPTQTELVTQSVSHSISSSLSESRSKSFSISTTASITPPPTPTQSLSHSATVSLSPMSTSTLSLEPTLSGSFSVSQSFSLSKSQTQTVTLTPTFTYSTSLTQSLDVWCGGVAPENCIYLKGWCNTSSEGICHAENCTNMPGAGLCLRQGCKWDASTNICGRPIPCSEERTMKSCLPRLSCRWTDNNICEVDRFPCDKQEVYEDCAGVGCAWNGFTRPNCFKPILDPALCRTIDNQAMCLAQKCLWLEVLDGCESWALNCTDMFPHPSTCPLVKQCVYEGSGFPCLDLSTLDLENFPFVKIFSATHPDVVFPGDAFDMGFFGTPLKSTNPVALINTGEKCPNAVNLTAWNSTSSTTFESAYYDKEQKQAVLVDVIIDTPGNYSFCILANQTHTLGPFGNISIRIPTPVLTRCATLPKSPYSLEEFQISMEGTGLDQDATVAIIPFTSNTSFPTCPDQTHASVYFPIRQHFGDSSMAEYTVDSTGSYLLCYQNRLGKIASCPSEIAIASPPPWLDKAILKEIGKTFPKLLSRYIAEYNGVFCYSMQDKNLTTGIFAHPKRMKMMFGDGTNPYHANEICYYAIQPMKNEELAPKAQKLMLDIFYLSLNKGDELRIFIAQEVTEEMSDCKLFGDADLCDQMGCTWSIDSTTGKGICSLVNQIIESCPIEMAGFDLKRAMTVDNFQSSATKEIPISYPGSVVLICSGSGVKTGIGVSMAYRAQETLCLNDCKDSQGTVNGRCIEINAEWKCQCNVGFAGEDCSRRAVCRGTGSNADAVTAAYGDEVVQLKSEPCGMLYTVDPSKSFMSNMQKYAVVIRISEATLSCANCDKCFIRIHSDTYTGRIVKTICQSEVNQAAADQRIEVYRHLFETTSSFYLEFASNAGDRFRLEFTAVSLVCPGMSAASGIPETDAEKCHGRGTCLRTELSSYVNTLPRSLMQCNCRLPHAASFVGGSCDTCGFGFSKDTFPACDPATLCAKNCTYRGTCIPGVGCHCQEGFYGIDCQLDDDAERLGLQSVLVSRLPLNGNDVGNVVQSGNIDRTMIACALPGSTIPCTSEVRVRGRKYDQADSDGLLATSISLLRRRQANTTTGNVTAVNNSIDFGLKINEMAVRGVYPDSIRTDNITGTNLDVFGEFTVLSWIKASSITKGFLIAKVDNAFTADGRSPVLEMAVSDVADRFTPMNNLAVLNSTLSVHFACFMNGAAKRVDILVSDISKKGTVASADKEDWLFVRHFRLGAVAGDLFDSSWRYFALRMSKKQTLLSARVYIDAVTHIGDPNFDQCLPFLPPEAPAHPHNVDNSTIAFTSPGQSLIWGFQFQGSVDELHIVRKALSQRSIVAIGGEDFAGVVDLPTSWLVSIGSISAFIALIWVPLVLIWKKRQHGMVVEKQQEEKKIADEKNEQTLAELMAIADAESEAEEEEEENGESEEEGQTTTKVLKFSTTGERSWVNDGMVAVDVQSADGQEKKQKAGEKKKTDGGPMESSADGGIALPLTTNNDVSAAEFTKDLFSDDLNGNFDASSGEPQAQLIEAVDLDDFETIIHRSNSSPSAAMMKKLHQLRNGENTPNATSSTPSNHSTDLIHPKRELPFVEHSHNKRMSSITVHSEEDGEEEEDEQEDKKKELHKDHPEAEAGGNRIRNGRMIVINDDSMTEEKERSGQEGLKNSDNSMSGQRLKLSKKGSMVFIGKDQKKNYYQLILQQLASLRKSIKILNKKMDPPIEHKSEEQQQEENTTKADGGIELGNQAQTIAMEWSEVKQTVKDLAQKETTLSGENSSVGKLEVFRLLVAAAEKRAAEKKGEVDRSAAGQSGDGLAAALPQIVSSSIESWQVTSQAGSSLSTPAIWAGSFGTIAFVINLDMGSMGAPFELVYYPLVIISFTCAAILVSVQLSSKMLSKAEVEEHVDEILEKRLRALRKDEEYEEKVGKKDKIFLILYLLLFGLYMPATQKSLEVIFCYGSIACQYDCYNEASHQVLVMVGGIYLGLVSFCIPIFFVVTVMRARQQFLAFLGSFDVTEEHEKMRAVNWPTFIQVVRSPFTGLYEKFHYKNAYFDCISLVYKAMISVFFISLPAESTAQLASVIGWQLIYVLLCSHTMPNKIQISNYMLAPSHAYVLFLLAMQCFYLLDQENGNAGVMMVLATVTILIYQLILIGYVLVMSRKSKQKKKDDGDQDREDKYLDDDEDDYDESKNSENTVEVI